VILRPYFSIFISLCLLCGCGYTTHVYNLPQDLQTVHVQIMTNKTDQPILEQELRTKLISELQNDGNLTIASYDDADTIIKGQIIGYVRQGLRYDNDEGVQEYRLTITVNFEFINKRTGKVIVSESGFTGDTDYFLTGSSAKSETTARSEALEDLAHRILNKIITLW